MPRMSYALKIPMVDSPFFELYHKSNSLISWGFTIFNHSHSSPFRFQNTEIWAGSVLGDLLRANKQFLRPIFILRNTVRQCCARWLPTTLVFRRLIDFRGFRLGQSIDKQHHSKGCRKRQKSIKVGHSCCYRIPRSRSFEYLRQSTKYTWSFDYTPKTKCRRRATAGIWLGGIAQPHVSATQGRASQCFCLW